MNLFHKEYMNLTLFHEKKLSNFRQLPSNFLGVRLLSHVIGALTLKRVGVNLTHPCSFSRNVFSRERVKHCFFVTFDIIISHIFSDNFIEIPQIVQKI